MIKHLVKIIIWNQRRQQWVDCRRDPAGIRGSVVHNRFANGGWESLLRPDGMGYRPCLLDLDRLWKR